MLLKVLDYLLKEKLKIFLMIVQIEYEQLDNYFVYYQLNQVNDELQQVMLIMLDYLLMIYHFAK